MTRRHALAILAPERWRDAAPSDLTSHPEAIDCSVSSIECRHAEQAAQIPFASIGIRVDGGPQPCWSLPPDTAGDLLWTSAAARGPGHAPGRIMQTPDSTTI